MRQRKNPEPHHAVGQHGWTNLRPRLRGTRRAAACGTRPARWRSCSTTTPPIPPAARSWKRAAASALRPFPLIRNSPGARFTCVDISAASLAEAAARVGAAGLPLPAFQQADLHGLPFADACFDHAFACLVLEHLPRPAAALAELRRVLKPGGTLTVIEGDHGSTFFHPDDPAAHAAIRCQVELQRAAGGDAMIGRRLHPLLTEAGFQAVRVSPRMVYVDASRPGAGRRLHPQDLHRDGRRRARRGASRPG